MNRIFFLISLGVLAGACSRSAQVAGKEAVSYTHLTLPTIRLV